jgi:hypothetical protein
MDALAQLLSGVSRCTAAWSLYGLVQCLVLLLFLLQLLVAWSFQPRLGIITQTLVAVIPAIAHLCLVIALCMAAFAAVLNMAVGTWAAPAATISSAWYDMFLQLLSGSEVNLVTLFPPGVVLTGAQQLLSGLILYMREALFAFVLMSYFLAALGATFAEVKKAADRAESAGRQSDARRRSIAADLVRYVVPEWVATARAMAWRLQRRDSSSNSGHDQNQQGWLKGRWGNSRATIAPEDVDAEAWPSQEDGEVEEVATTLEGPLRRRPTSAQRRARNMQQQQQQRQQGVGLSCCQLETWLPAPPQGQQQEQQRLTAAAAGMDLRAAVPLWGPSGATTTLGGISSRDQCSTAGPALDMEALQLLVVCLVLEDQQRAGAGSRGAAGAVAAAQLVQQLALQPSVPQQVRRMLRPRNARDAGSSVTELPPGWPQAPETPAAAEVGAGPAINPGMAAAAAVAAAVLRALGVPAPPASVAAGQALLQQESWTSVHPAALVGASGATATSTGDAGPSSSAWAFPATEAGQAVVTLKVTRPAARPGWEGRSSVQGQVYAALWVAIREMQQWASAAHKWHQQVAKEMAAWSEQSEQLAARHRDGSQVLPLGVLPSSSNTLVAAAAGPPGGSRSSGSGGGSSGVSGLRKRVSASGHQGPALGSSGGSGSSGRGASGAGGVHQQKQQQPRTPAALAEAGGGAAAGDSTPAAGAAGTGSPGIRSSAGLEASKPASKPAAPLSLLGQLLGGGAGKDGKGVAKQVPAGAAAVTQQALPATAAAGADGSSAPAAATFNANMPAATDSSSSSSSGRATPFAAQSVDSQAPREVGEGQASSATQAAAASPVPAHGQSGRPASSASNPPLSQAGQEAAAADTAAEQG